MSKMRRWFVVLTFAVTLPVAYFVTSFILGVQRYFANFREVYESAAMHNLGVALVDFSSKHDGALPSGEQWKEELISSGVDLGRLNTFRTESGYHIAYRRTDALRVSPSEPSVIAFEEPSTPQATRIRIVAHTPVERSEISVYWVDKPYWSIAVSGELPPEAALERAAMP